ncbi:hypothetical protein ACOMHN_052168 [Nucella lapillus]
MLMMRAKVQGHRWVDHPAAAVMEARVPGQWVDRPAAVAAGHTDPHYSQLHVEVEGPNKEAGKTRGQFPRRCALCVLLLFADCLHCHILHSLLLRESLPESVHSGFDQLDSLSSPCYQWLGDGWGGGDGRKSTEENASLGAAAATEALMSGGQCGVDSPPAAIHCGLQRPTALVTPVAQTANSHFN